MGVFGALFEPASPMPTPILGDVPSRRTSLRPEDLFDMPPEVEAKYPRSIWAPPRNTSPSPASDVLAPYEFKKRELVAACRQGMRMSGMGQRYPRPWSPNDEPTDYMAFPILPGQRLWDGGEPGRFRIVYHRYDGTFHRVVMHRYTTPLTGGNVGLGFSMPSMNPNSAPGSHSKLVKSPPMSSSRRYSESHPVRQNPPGEERHPLRLNPPDKAMPWCPDDIGRVIWNTPVFEIDSGPVFPARGKAPREKAPRHTSLPVMDSMYDLPPLVKVKSAPGTLRRPSCGWPLPDDLPTIISTPPTAMIKSSADDIPPLPPLDAALRIQSMPLVPSLLNTVPSPQPEAEQEGQFVGTAPRKDMRPKSVPTPLIDRNELLITVSSPVVSSPVESRRSNLGGPPKGLRRSSIVSSHQPSAEPRRPSVGKTPTGLRRASYAPSSLVARSPSEQRRKSLAAPTGQRRASPTISPISGRSPVEQEGSSIPPSPVSALDVEFAMLSLPESSLSSFETSHTRDESFSYMAAQTPAAAPVEGDMVPAPLDVQSRPASPALTTPSLQNRSPSPRSLSCSSFASIERRSSTEASSVISDPPVFNEPIHSPMMRSPNMPQGFTCRQSPTVGYDPRLPIKSPRVSPVWPSNNGQSPKLGQETPTIKSPVAGAKPSKPIIYSPMLRQIPAILRSPPLPEIQVWTDQPQLARLPNICV